MNQFSAKPVELPVEIEKSSSAEKSSSSWIRAQFHDNAGEDRSEGSPAVGTIKLVDRGNAGPPQELDGSLRELAAALLKVGELPAQALQQKWSQKLAGLDSRLSEQTATLATAKNEIASLEAAVGEISKNSSEREDQTERTTTEVEQLRVRMDGFEADLGRRLGQVSSLIEKLHGEMASQQTTLTALQQEGDRRREVAEKVSQVLDTLKTSVNLLGGEPAASQSS